MDDSDGDYGAINHGEVYFLEGVIASTHYHTGVCMAAGVIYARNARR